MGRYVAITYPEMRETVEDKLGFVRADSPDAWEMIWERPVTTKSGKEYPYRIRLYSSVDIRTGVSREVGEDAIRLVLMDNVMDRPIKSAEKRVFRTKNALLNIRERAADLFLHVMNGPHCPKCGSLMVERQGGPNKRKFLGCTHYGPNNAWHCTGTREIE